MYKLIELGDEPREYTRKIIFKEFAFEIKGDGEQCYASYQQAIADFLQVQNNGVFSDLLYRYNNLNEMNFFVKTLGLKPKSKKREDVFECLFDYYKNVRPLLRVYLITNGVTPQELDSYESDLYVKKSETSERLLKEYQNIYSPIVIERFQSCIDGSDWFSIPFENATTTKRSV